MRSPFITALLLAPLAALHAADSPLPTNRYVPLCEQIIKSSEATAAKAASGAAIEIK